MSRLLRESDRYERQIRAFGPELQEALAHVTIAVIGLGGIGSLITQALTHLGARTLILADPDTVSTSNLNRLTGAGPADIGEAKVDIARRAALATQPSATVTTINGSVTNPQTWSRLRPADLLVGAVDAHAPRWALNRLAIQYARHYIDTGVDLRRGPDGVEAGGHVAVVHPTGPCLLCLSGYDPAAVATELDPHLATARSAAGYRVDDGGCGVAGEDHRPICSPTSRPPPRPRCTVNATQPAPPAAPTRHEPSPSPTPHPPTFSITATPPPAQ